MLQQKCLWRYYKEYGFTPRLSNLEEDGIFVTKSNWLKTYKKQIFYYNFVSYKTEKLTRKWEAMQEMRTKRLL